MNTQKYYRLLEHLKKGRQNEKDDTKLKKWAEQFEEKLNHIYKGKRRVIPRYEVEWIIGNPTTTADPTKGNEPNPVTAVSGSITLVSSV